MARESLDKFECRACSCRQSKIRATETMERRFGGRLIVIVKRRRVCRHCGLSTTTVEHQYEDIGQHPIPSDGILRPAYDAGRQAGTLETINGLLKMSEELSTLPLQKAPIPQNPPDFARELAAHLQSPSTKKPPHKKKPKKK